jgi:DNA polymerase V
MRRIFRAGYRYVKAGVMLWDLRARSIVQGSLFDASPEFDDRRTRLMAVLDRASAKWGRGVLAPGSAGMTARWAMKRERMTPAYTTRWAELVQVSC